MCRSIVSLYNFDPPVTEPEIQAAALQFVRKISGMNRPSRANQAAFDKAVQEIATASAELLSSLVTTAPAHDRQVEREKARLRQRRFERPVGVSS